MTQREQTYEALLRAAVGQLKAWGAKYGQHGPSWLPPGGDLDLMQTIDDWLATAPAQAAQPAQRCHYCDGTGDVHTPTGEWRGGCTACIHRAADELIAAADRAGLRVSVERRPLKPLAMGNAEYVVDIRPVRGAS